MPSTVRTSPCHDSRAGAVPSAPIGRQPLRDRLRIVVLASHELGGTAHVAHAWHLGRLERVVIARATLGAAEAPGDPLDSAWLSTFISTTASRVSPRSASIRSSPSACGMVRGKPSRMNPLAASGWSIRSATIRLMIVVGDQPARLHDRLGLAADLGALGHRLAQHLAGRELRDGIGLLQPRRLGALPRPGGPSRISLIRAFLSAGPS